MKKVRYVITVFLIVLMSFVLTGCSDGTLSDVVDDYIGALTDVETANLKTVEKLIYAGILDSATGERLKKQISETADRYTSVDNQADVKGIALDAVSKSITPDEFRRHAANLYKAYYDDLIACENMYGVGTEEAEDAKANVAQPNIIRLKNLMGTTNAKVITTFDEYKADPDKVVWYSATCNPQAPAKTNPVAIPFLSMTEGSNDWLNDLRAIPVYVLKSSTYASGSWTKEQYENKYRDLSMDEVVGAISDLKNNTNVVEAQQIMAKYFDKTGQSILGDVEFIKERTISLTSDGKEALWLRVSDFNHEAIADIYGDIEAVEGKYFIYTDGNGNKSAYLLEYPLFKIKSLVPATDGGEEWSMTYESTGMTVNFYSGELFYSGNLLTTNGDPMYHVTNATGSSSFMFGPELQTYTNIGSGNVSITNCLQIVIRDYLEYIYLPDVVKDESLVALGRRIRVEHTKGNLDTVFGHFIDKKGEKVGDTSIMATNLIGNNSGSTGAENTAIKPALKYASTPQPEGNVENDDTGMLNSKKLLYKTWYIFNPVVVCDYFATSTTTKVAKIDAGRTEIKAPRLYGITTDINIFDSGLYNTWIAPTDTTSVSGNLTWWNKWLLDNHFKYTIDLNRLNESLGYNYSYELAKEGKIILDLETIAKIQKDYDREAEVAGVTGVRTAFLILGTLLIAYSILILVAWAFDVNITNGPKMLGKLTFGHWVAVASSDEVPNIGTGNMQYFNFGAIMTRSLIIASVGVLLYIIDFVKIVSMIWGLFSALAETILKAIFNIF